MGEPGMLGMKVEGSNSLLVEDAPAPAPNVKAESENEELSPPFWVVEFGNLATSGAR